MTPKMRGQMLYGPFTPVSKPKPKTKAKAPSASGVKPGGLQRVWGAAHRMQSKAAKDYRSGPQSGRASALERGKMATRVKQNMLKGTLRAPRRG